MVKASKAIKAFYSKMEHKTCLARVLHRVAGRNRKMFFENRFSNNICGNRKKFSSFKTVLFDNHRSILFQNIMHTIIVQYNNFSDKKTII